MKTPPFCSISVFFVAMAVASLCCSCSDSKHLPTRREKVDLDWQSTKELQVGPLRREMEKVLPIADFNEYVGNNDLEDVLREFREASSRPFNNPDIPDGPLTDVNKVKLGFCVYLNLVLRDDCPQQERVIFCNLVEAVMIGFVSSVDGELYAGLMVLLASDGIIGWAKPGGWNGDVKAAIEFWHSSEIYQYLMFGTPFKSPELKERLESINANW